MGGKPKRASPKTGARIPNRASLYPEKGDPGENPQTKHSMLKAHKREATGLVTKTRAGAELGHGRPQPKPPITVKGAMQSNPKLLTPKRNQAFKGGSNRLALGIGKRQCIQDRH